MVTKNEIVEKLILILEDVVPTVGISAENLHDSLSELGYDSLDLSTFVMEVEHAFKTKISDEEFGTLTTLDKFANFLDGRIQ